MNTKIKHNARIAVVAICRIALALTFIFSGTVKLIDPQGVQYKIEDYALAFGLWDWAHGLSALAMGVALSLTEFLLGVYLLFGIRRRSTSRLMLLFMLVMTPLTLYLMLENPVTDCGCFGDAVRLTNSQTFAKNLALLAMAFVVALNRRRMARLITERNQWLVSLYALVFALVFVGYNLYRLPVVDFRPYHIGADLRGAVREARYGSVPDMELIDFAMLTPQGDDITEQWLAHEGTAFLLVAPFLPVADDANTDRINDLYDYCRQHGYPFLCLTSSDEDDMERWRDATGAEYPMALTDGTVLKTVIRSNPGLLMLRDGIIADKRAHSELPQVDNAAQSLEQLGLAPRQPRSYLASLLHLLLLFVGPPLLFAALDRLWVGSKLYRRYRIRHINQTKVKTLHEKEDCSR